MLFRSHPGLRPSILLPPQCYSCSKGHCVAGCCSGRLTTPALELVFQRRELPFLCKICTGGSGAHFTSWDNSNSVSIHYSAVYWGNCVIFSRATVAGFDPLLVSLFLGERANPSPGNLCTSFLFCIRRKKSPFSQPLDDCNLQIYYFSLFST